MAENINTYLTILLTDNENIKNVLTNYLNTLLAVKAVYDKANVGEVTQAISNLSKSISPQEKANIIQTVNGFRAYATRIKISLNVLKEKFPKDVWAQIEEDYIKIKSEPLPEYDVCERFVQNINDMLGTQLKVASTFESQA